MSINNCPKYCLRESPKTAIERFIRDGALVDCELYECLATTLTSTELKKLIKERRLTQTGTKSDLAYRLIDADRQGMEEYIHNKKFMRCSDSAVELIKKYQTTKEESFELAKRKSYEALLTSDTKEAYKIFVTYQREFISSKFGSWPYMIKSLDSILTSHPKVLGSMSPNNLDNLRAAICMEKLWRSSAENWLSDDFTTPLKNNEMAINLLKCYVEIQDRLVRYSNYTKKVKIIFDEYDVDSCEHCLALNGKTFNLNEFPELPFENCTSEVGCKCRIETIYDEGDRFANLMISTNYDYEEEDESKEDDAFIKLSQLKKMLEHDLITEEEYQKKKTEILSRM